MTPILISVALGAVILLGVDVSGQTTIMSSLQPTNRMYVCPGEIVTYVCSGTGDQIRLYAPPYVDPNTPVLYMRGDTLGTGNLSRGPIVLNLISTGPPLMVADLIVQNASLPEFSIHCAVRSPIQENETQHRPSEPPLDVSSQKIIGNPDNGTVQVTWIQNIGNYDLSYYTVQLLEANAETQWTVVSAESNSLIAVFSVPFNVNVSARITVTSKCVQTSTGVSTNTTSLIQPPTTTRVPQRDNTTENVFLGLLSAATIILAIVVFVLGVYLCTKNC